MEGDRELRPVYKTKYRFVYGDCRFELDVYPFSSEKAILFRYGEDGENQLPPEITVLENVTGNPAYKNRQLARTQKL